MMTDIKKAITLFPHLYQAKQNAAMIFVFVFIAFVTQRNDGNGLDLAMFIFFMGVNATILMGVLLRMDYSDMMAASPYRKRIAFRVAPLLTWLSLILCWCLVVVFSYMTGKSVDLYGANALVLIALYLFFSLFSIGLTLLGGKYNRIVSMVLMVVMILLIIAFFMVVQSARVSEKLISLAALLRIAEGLTPPLTIAAVALCSVLPVLFMLLLLRLTYKRPVRREYLEKLRG